MSVHFFSLISILFLFGCSKNTELIIEKDKIVGLDHIQMEIEDIKIVEWKVGEFRAQRLHKGFLLMMKLPRLSTKLVEEITTKSPVDSWVVRFTKTTMNGGSRLLGTVYVPFYSYNEINGTRRVNTQEALYENVYYAAAALSGRLENLKCPALNHRKMIDKWELKKSEGPKKIIMSFSNILPETPAKSEILPENFNGDSSLEGEYSAELAFYNSESKVLHSEFVKVGNSVKITSEKEVFIKECENFQVPPVDYDKTEDKMKQFRFK